MKPILEVKNLTYIYSAGTPFEHKALDDISFSVERGEFIGIIGHTGSGKSTLIQQLNGLLKPYLRHGAAGRAGHLVGQEADPAGTVPGRAGVPVPGVSAV